MLELTVFQFKLSKFLFLLDLIECLLKLTERRSPKHMSVLILVDPVDGREAVSEGGV